MLSILLALLPAVSAQYGLCLPCRVVLTQGFMWYENQGGREMLADYQSQGCAYLFSKTTCDYYLPRLSIITDALFGRFITPDVCSLYTDCPSPVYIKEDLTKWQENLLASKPSYTAVKPTNLKSFRFAQISDVHIDPLYTEGASTICDGNTCCRAGDGTDKPVAGYWGDFNCDIPVRTFESALQSLYTKGAEFIIMTGDYGTNNWADNTQATRLSAVSLVTSLLLKYFQPAVTPVYPVLGNHDCSPSHQFNFGQEAWITGQAATMWQSWLPASAQASFKATGSYTLLHKNSKLRILAINTFACSNYNFYLLRNATDPGSQIEFMRTTLLGAEKNGEMVYIIGHMAPGSPDCLTPWAARYAAIVDRFQGVIRGQFFGGSHHDEFKVNRGVFTGSPVGTLWVGPSLSTYKYRNPSYRVYTADSDTSLLADVDTYRMDLEAANSAVGKSPTWDLAYSFKSSYVVSDLLPSSLLTMLGKLNQIPMLMLGFLDNYYTAGPQTPRACGDSCRSDFACQVSYGQLKEIDACQGLSSSLQTTCLEFATGSWAYRK